MKSTAGWDSGKRKIHDGRMFLGSCGAVSMNRRNELLLVLGLFLSLYFVRLFILSTLKDLLR